MKNPRLIDLRNKNVFPTEGYRFSSVSKTGGRIVLERDFMGENPLHYYLDSSLQEIVVANSIREIRDYLKKREAKFVWEHVRAVSNNKKVTIDSTAFYHARPQTVELGPVLQNMKPPFNPNNIERAGSYLREALTQSIHSRLKTIKAETVGLLLSGGLDSITTGYFLERDKRHKRIRAFTLKVNENDPDITKSREIAKRLSLPLTEVKIGREGVNVLIDVEVYDKTRRLINKYHLSTENMDEVVKKTLEIAENPKKDNLLCSVAMYLIGQVLKKERISVAFCGEGPNEMINDYGFKPPREGYPGMGVSSTYFRQALTFGLKESDAQLGRGGLAKHALSRMGKVFAYYGIRLESPFFNPVIANILTRVPYEDKDYGIIKPKIDQAILGAEGRKVLGSLDAISKEKFQDGSGISKLFNRYTQEKLTGLFREIYGVNKESYLKKQS